MTLYANVVGRILEVNGNIYITDTGHLSELRKNWWSGNYTKVTDNPKTITKIMRLQGICLKEVLDTASSV